MCGIARARSLGFLDPDFNEFLYASVGADQHGDYLSVVSALARLDLDPWTEAAKLAKLPAEVATQKLSSLIAALQEIPSDRREPCKIAARLVALLPGARNTKVTPTLSITVPKVMAILAPAFYVFLCAVALMIVIQFVTFSVQSPASHPVSRVASSVLSSDASAKSPVPLH
jgi:hypothetical protein